MADEPNKLVARAGKRVDERPARELPTPARAGLRVPRVLFYAPRPGHRGGALRSTEERHRLGAFRVFLGLLNIIILLLAWNYRDVLFPLGNLGLGASVNIAVILVGVPAAIAINFLVQMMLAAALLEVRCPFWLLVMITLLCAPVSLGLVRLLVPWHG